jgi:hypothetical protein
MHKPIIDNKFLLRKIPGKGGWTYAELPLLTHDSKIPFGWVKVKGSIDGVAIKKYHLMPNGKGSLFFPVRAEIRKKIKKEAGDYVHVILFPDDEPLEIPEEMLLCLQDEPRAFHFFSSLEESEKQQYIKWVYAAKTDQKKIDRLAKAIDKLKGGRKFYNDKE